MALQLLLNYRELNIIDMGPDTASFVGELAADLRLRGADAAFVAVAMLQDLPLITFDNEQRERARYMVVAQAPP
jgi:predicted nucleic acid-binding protein